MTGTISVFVKGGSDMDWREHTCGFYEWEHNKAIDRAKSIERDFGLAVKVIFYATWDKFETLYASIQVWFDETKREFENRGIAVSAGSWLDLENNRAYVASVITSKGALGQPLFEAQYTGGAVWSTLPDPQVANTSWF